MDWDNPELTEWLETLHKYIDRCGAAPVLVAHSLACSLVAHWVKSFGCGVASTNDPHVQLARAEFFAKSWGSRFVGRGSSRTYQRRFGRG